MKLKIWFLFLLSQYFVNNVSEKSARRKNTERPGTILHVLYRVKCFTKVLDVSFSSCLIFMQP